MITKEQLDNWEGEVANLRAQLAQAQERVRELEHRFIQMAERATCALELAIRKSAEIAQRDAEIARLVADQQWLDPGAVELIRAFGTFSIERLPDWNFAVAIKGDIYGIGMTVFDAISSAAAQIDKIKAMIKEAKATK